jgi:PAS domain S-box-containing protein
MLDQFRRFLAPPIFDDEEKTRVSQFMINSSWVAIGTLLGFILLRIAVWRDPNFTPTVILSVIIILLFGMQFFVKRGHVYVVSTIMTFIFWITMTYLAWSADGLRDLALIAYIVIILSSSLLLGWRFTLLIGAMSISSIWYFAYLEETGLRPIKMNLSYSYAFDLTGILILVGTLIYFLITGWTRTLQSARLELRERLRAEEKLQKQADYLTALHETALGLLNRSELYPLLESILTRACDLVRTKHGQIEFVLPDGTAMKQELGLGVLSRYNGMLTAKGEGVPGNVWSSGQSLVVQEYPKWDQALPEFISEGFNAVLGVPLKLEETVIGVLVVSFVGEDRRFTNEEIHLMERFAALAALAIQNARLHEQAQKELHERGAIELALRDSEERFRKVFQASPVAICITSLEEGVLLEANEAFWKISGFDPSTSIGLTAKELNMVESMENRRELVERLKREHSIYNPDDNFITLQSEPRSAHTFYELIEIKGQPCILTMLYDVTEHMQAQNALKEAEARTRALLTAIPDMIFEISKEGIFTGYIPSSEITPVMPPEQFLGKNIRDLFPPLIAEQTLFSMERALETNQLHAFEYGMPPGEEIQFFEARVSAVSSELAIVMVRDISRRIWIETEREKLIKELEDKNAELERFTYTVSHDLKSPLITIKGFLGFIEQDAANGNTTRVKADIKRIADAADKMQLLLNELLELSRIGRLTNPYEQIPFEEIAREAVELVQGRILNAKALVQIQSNMPSVYGDRRRLVEVLQNLVDNAAKFVGGHPHPKIEIGQQGEEDGKPIFFVRDNGVGIQPQHQDRIFGLFNKLDADSDGTGIGLTLVKRIIEVHHGRIWIQSEAGKGATFFFTLRAEPES